MSQKTHPNSLRIASKYKNFYSCWYSDFFYSEMLSYDLEIRSYIESLCEQSKHTQVIIRLQNNYKRFFINLFLLDARGIRYSAEKVLRLPILSLQRRAKVNSLFNLRSVVNSSNFLNASKRNPFQKKSPLAFSNVKDSFQIEKDLNLNSFLFDPLSSLKPILLQGFQEKSNGMPQCPARFALQYNGNFRDEPKLISNNVRSSQKKSIPSTFSSQNQNQNQSQSQNFRGFGKGEKVEKYSINKEKRNRNASQYVHSFLEKNIDSKVRQGNAPKIFCGGQNSTLFNFPTIYPVKVLQEVQNAEFLAGEIVYLLQKRAHFRQIQSFILRKIDKNQFIIKGIRLSCSGRVGGRSKKAQKSKTQSLQWGETSLHVFSSKLDFASKSASTLFGKVGVKVWLCYR